MVYEVELFDDPLDALLKINCDSLINMVLHYLSCIPIQYSFQKMQPKLSDLAEYSRFVDYISSWPQQTDQMKATAVLYTDKEQGIHYESENCSYLSKDFFDRHPIESTYT